MRKVLEKAGLTKKLNAPASAQNIAEWENHILEMVEEDCNIDRRDMLVELGLWQPLQ